MDAHHVPDKRSKEKLPALHPEHPCLIVIEGIDLSGRTTQVQLLHDWLLAQRYHVTTTAWRTSPLISDVLARARKKNIPLRPRTYSMLYAADHIDRTEHIIKPALARGEIVLADRYIYTAFARDAARGLDTAWVENLYHYSVQPDIVFYLHIDPEEAVQRRLHTGDSHASKSFKAGKHHKHTHSQQKDGSIPSSPLPQSIAGHTLETFRSFERKMYSEYQRMQQTFDFTVIEGNQSIDQVQATLRRAVMHLLLNG